MRRGAFWEDRYHATVVEGDEHLQRCVVYIDLNMVRAGVVRHPAAWAHGGYREIQDPPERYALIDLAQLAASCGFSSLEEFRRAHRQWVEHALAQEKLKRESRWSEAIAVGSRAFVEEVKRELALKARYREIGKDEEGSCELREPRIPYTGVFEAEKRVLRGKNGVYWS